jgi:hypothetical protein
MNDVEHMLINEYRRIDRAIAHRAQVLDQLEKKAAVSRQNQLNRRPKRYSVEFEFTPGDLQAQTRSFFVDGGTTFRPKNVESSFRVTGVTVVEAFPDPNVPGQIASVTLPYGPVNSPGSVAVTRNNFFDYFWTIRDTGSDREWQNRPQPSVFMDSGALGPLQLPVHARVRGGAEVFITVDPFFSSVIPTPFDSISRYTLHISLFGTEVRG